jgi:hypothetical protein
MKYTIYYGIKPNGEPKVGCDSNYPNRALQTELTDYRILESHDDVYIASYREVDLQLELIGKRDSNSYYYQTLEHAVKGRQKNREAGNIAKMGRDFGKINGKLNRKLTFKQAEEIRRIYKIGEYSQKQVGELFGASARTVSDIINRKKYIEQ